MPSLYMTEPGTRLEIEAGRLLCSRGDDVLLAVPAARVDQVVIVTGCHVTTPAFAFLLDRKIDLLFVTMGGSFRGRLDAGDCGPIELRRAQYRRGDDPAFCLALAQAIVAGKIRNARTRCMELDEGRDPRDALAIRHLRDALDAVPGTTAITDVMGVEGRAARWYFSVLRHHLREPWTFRSRQRRPPPDPVNALLSILYTLLHEQCRTALVAAGLDPAVGYLHQPRAGRLSLALDLMEEFRPVIADAVAWGMLNKRMLSPQDFSPASRDGVRLSAEGWRVLASQYNRRLNTGILVPGRRTRTTYRKLLEIQARHLAGVIAGRQETYEPFRSR